MARPTIASVTPLRAVEGGRITLKGSGFPVDTIPEVTVGGQRALVAFASSTRIVVAIPPDVESGPAPIRIEDLPGATAYVNVGGAWATGLHQVDNPIFDADGNLFVTYSGSRGQESPVSIFDIRPRKAAHVTQDLPGGKRRAVGVTLQAWWSRDDAKRSRSSSRWASA